MKKIVLALLFIGGVCSAQDAELSIKDLSAGKIDVVGATRIPNNSVYDCRNVYFDGESIAEKRKGMTKINSTALGDGAGITAQYTYQLSNGTRYHIVCSSETIYYRQSGNEYSVIANGLSTTYPTKFAVFIDTLTWVNGVDNMQSWDTSSVFTQEATYQPRYIHVWQNRIWIAGDVSDGLSKVRCSEWLDPSDYAVPASAVSTDPAVFDINSQDGQKVMGFGDSPNGNLMIFKENSVYEIGGYDRDDFYLRKVLDIGCVDTGSVVDREGIVTWLSNQGFVGYDGHTYRVISNNIENTGNIIQQLNSGSGAFVKNTSVDWERNTYNRNIDTTSNPGKIQLDLIPINDIYGGIISVDLSGDILHILRYTASPSKILYSSYSHTSNSLLGEKTIDQGSPYTFSTSGRHAMAIDSADDFHVLYAKQISGTYQLIYASFTISGDVTISTITNSGVDSSQTSYHSIALDSGDIPHLLYGVSSALYYTSSTSSGWSTPTVVDPDATSSVIQIDDNDVIHIVYAKDDYAVSDIKYASSSLTSISFSPATIYKASGYIKVADMEINSSSQPYVAHGLNNSTTFKITSHNGVAWSTATYTLNSKSDYNTDLEFDSDDNIALLYSDTSGSGDNNLYFMNSGGTSYSADNETESARWPARFKYDSNDYPIGICERTVGGSAKAAIYVSTGTYMSEIFDTSLAAYTFGEFISDYKVSNQDIYQYLRSSDTASNILTTDWTLLTNGQAPTAEAAQYIQYKCTLSNNILSNALSYINRIQVNYYTTVGSTYISSMLYDKRIWNAVSISSATYLDRQLIYDTNDAWTDFTSAIGCRSLLNYDGTPYWGGDDGYVYLMDVGDNDEDYTIESWFETKAYDIGSLIYQKTIDKIYVIANEMGDWNLTLDYYLDGSGTSTGSYDIDLDQTDNMINYKIAPSGQIPFYTLQYKLSNNNSDEPWELLEIYSTFRRLPLR